MWYVGVNIMDECYSFNPLVHLHMCILHSSQIGRGSNNLDFHHNIAPWIQGTKIVWNQS